MKAISGKRLCELLESKGWEAKRMHGSHHIYIKVGIVTHISVPVHDNKALKHGLQSQLMKVAEIGEHEL